jgi:predicted RecB family nuclease
VFEASFLEDRTFAAVDILERSPEGWSLFEVKSSTSQKPEHIPDVAVQLHVLRAAGIAVAHVSVMHLNPDFRSPDVGDRFVTTDVTEEASAYVAEVEDELERQMTMLTGTVPDVPIGGHCNDPRRCPFMDRCWPTDRDHISKLYNVGPKRAVKYMGKGIHRIHEIPASQKLPDAARRQVRALSEDRLVVEPGLAEGLEEFSGTLGFLDFETIFRAIPPWPGLKPWGQAAAQFSYHEEQLDGSYTHTEWLAEGPEDARPSLARAMVRATRGSDRVVTYSSFEKTRIRALQEAVPALRSELRELEDKLIDLLPVVRGFVYHPDFEGSFSIKSVLKPLVPDLGYDDLIIVDGRVASVEIARLLFVSGKIALHEHDTIRQDLLRYCERDTWAMLKLLEALRALASDQSQTEQESIR